MMLTGCDEALGLAPERDLSRAALRRAAGRAKVEVEASRASRSYDASKRNATNMRLRAALDGDFYFETKGTLLEKISRSKRRGMWLERAFEQAFGGFFLGVDSVQMDNSVGAHEHMSGWLYLASGLKLWYTSPMERAPPAEALWALPHTSWLREGAPPVPLQTWAPQVCMQRPGDVMLLPQFAWHATVSLGKTVALGQQIATGPNVPMPRLVQALRDADGESDRRGHSTRERTEHMLDAMWALSDVMPGSPKILLKVAAYLQAVDQSLTAEGEEDTMRDLLDAHMARLLREARAAAALAERLVAQGRIGQADAEPPWDEPPLLWTNLGP